jgi:hypothetical protein
MLLDDLVPFSDDSLSRMQRNVFDRLRPLESMPMTAASPPVMGKVSNLTLWFACVSTNKISFNL